MYNLKKDIFSIVCALSIMSAYGQNIVPNPGFEEYIELPDDQSQWDRCNDWNNAGGTPIGGFYGSPDYFHVDGEDPIKLPDTPLADLDAHTGDAIMGFLGYHDPYLGSEIREYIMVELTEAMTIGTQYEISFWITNGFEGHGHRFKCDGIAINLSTSPLEQDGSAPILDTPELEIDGELFTTEWEQKTFTFTADEEYTYLTIGNFYSDEETSVSIAVEGPLPFAGAYYFIDDFSVQANESGVGIEDHNSSELFSIAPNPANDHMTISFIDNNVNEVPYTIYSTTGQQVQTGIIQGGSPLLIDDLDPGFYLIDIFFNDIHSQQKFVKD